MVENPAAAPKTNQLKFQEGNFNLLSLTLLNQMAHKLDNIDNNLVAAIEVGEDILKELKKGNPLKGLE